MESVVSETQPEKLQNGHKKKSKKKNKKVQDSTDSNPLVNSCSSNHCSSVTELDEISLQLDNCHIKENGLPTTKPVLLENGVAMVTKVNKKKKKNKKPLNPDVVTDSSPDKRHTEAEASGGSSEEVEKSSPLPHTTTTDSCSTTLQSSQPTNSTQPSTSSSSSLLSSTAPTESVASTSATMPAEEVVESKEQIEIKYIQYESEEHMPDIMRVIQKDLSEPYSIYTYRYFIHNWPNLCFLALHETKCVGAIVCKFDLHRDIRRGYIAMLAVDKDYRKLKIGTTLVQKAIKVMVDLNADEVVLETEITNKPALRLYENLGFVRDKRLFYYYLNGVDALRLKLWFR